MSFRHPFRRFLPLILAAAAPALLLAATPSTRQGDLFAAVRAGDLPKVEALLASGASPKVRDADGMTPLHYAAFRGEVAMGEALLAAGADADAADSIGMTPLDAASFDGRDKFAALLISKKAAVNVRDKAGMTPLHYAAANGNEETIRLLLSKGADPRALDSRGRVPADLAAGRKRPDLAALLKPPPENTAPVAKEGRRYTDEDLLRMSGGPVEDDDYPCRKPPERPKSDRAYWLRYLEQGEQQLQRLAAQKHDLEASLPDLQRRCEEAKQRTSQASVGAASGPEILAPTPPGSYTNSAEIWRRQQAAAQPCAAYQSALQRIRTLDSQIRKGRESLERYRLQLDH